MLILLTNTSGILLYITIHYVKETLSVITKKILTYKITHNYYEKNTIIYLFTPIINNVRTN